MAEFTTKFVSLLLLFTLCYCKEEIDHEDDNTIKTFSLKTSEPLRETESILTDSPPLFKSINELCEVFGVAKENCSCKLFTVMVGSTESMCDFPLTNETETRVVYESELSLPVGSVSFICSIVGIIGNVAVIGVLLKIHKKLSTWKRLIGMLAVSELSFSLIQLATSIPLFWTNRWLYGSFMCKMLGGGRLMESFLYIGFLLIIAMENYTRIVNRNQLFSTLKTKILVGVNFVLAFTTTLPMFVIFHVNKQNQCVGRWHNNETLTKVYNCIVIALYFIAPVTAILLLISKMKVILKEQRKESKADVIRAHCNVTYKQMIENQRTLKLLIAMLVSFIMCVLPNRIVWLYFDYSDRNESRDTYKVIIFIGLLTYYILVAVNPIVYSICDVKWRRSLITVTIQPLKNIKDAIVLVLKSKTSDIRISNMKVSNVEGFTTTKKTFGPKLNNLNVMKDNKGRNLSIDQGTHLLSYNGNYLTMSKGVKTDMSGKN